MATQETKERICNEFMSKYREWLNDAAHMDEYDYSRKYGYKKPEAEYKDNLKEVTLFQKYFFAGRYLPAWEKAGYDRADIYALHREGFLSYDYDSSWKARQLKKTDFYYISQKTAKEIYKAYR